MLRGATADTLAARAFPTPAASLGGNQEVRCGEARSAMELLSQVDLFDELTEPELRKVATLAKELDFPADEVITEEGTPGGWRRPRRRGPPTSETTRILATA